MHQFDGWPRRVILPQPADFMKVITEQGKEAYMWSVDVSRCYKRLPVCPKDWPFLGMHFRDSFYMEKHVLFGSRHGGLVCQLLANAFVWFVYQQRGIKTLVY